MTIFKTIALILKKNKTSLSVGLIISVALSFLYAGTLNQNNNISLDSTSIAIFDKDSSDISKGLTDYLNTTAKVETLENTQKAKDDALYFEQVDYILTIPKNFSEELLKGKTPKLDVQVRPGSYSKTLVDGAVNHYLNTFSAYQRIFPDKELKEQLAYTEKNLSVQGKVSTDSEYAVRAHRKATAGVFDLLSYGLFASTFLGIACIYLAFNRQEIRQRNLCSPISQKGLTRKIFVSSLLYSSFVLLVFLVYNLIYTRSSFNGYTLLFVANTLMFFLSIITFSLMITSLSSNNMVTSVVNNTFILGSCFISGVFVPSRYLPDIVIKASMLTPTYWFTDMNWRIAEAVVFDQAFYQELLFHFIMLLCFSIAFLVINRIRQTDFGQLNLQKKSL